MDKTEKRWTKVAKDILLNRKITYVRYLNDEELKEAMWYKKPIAMLLDNGVWIYPSMDDEGNDGGALFTTDEREYCLPVI